METPIFSPFSSKARCLASHRDQILKEDGSKTPLFGFKHCRSVSVLLNIGIHPSTYTSANICDLTPEDCPDEEGYGPILFPFKDGDKGEVVLVNPHAFENAGSADGEEKKGERKRIVGRVTVETARLVAEVSNVSSEDWARKYRYDEIIWPNNTSYETEQSIDTVSALARAAAHDLLDGKNSTICTVGGRQSGKSRLVFGREISKCVSLRDDAAAEAESDDYHGILGHILNILGDQTQARCSLSIVEVVDEEILRDVLGFAYHELNEHDGHRLKLRHFDQNGASLENLRKISVDPQSMDEVLDAFNNERLHKIWSKEGGHGHFIATIVVEGGGMIQLLDCASADRTIPSNVDLNVYKQKHNRRMNSIRKSLSSLRGVFRALVIAQDTNDLVMSNNTSPSVSFRECTLTQLLQRGLCSKDGEEKSRAVVIGAVCPSTKAYSQTLSTMDYTTRLLARQGNTASDPFHNKLATGDKKTYDRDSLMNSALASVLPQGDDEDFDQDRSFRSFHSLTHRTPSMKSRPSTAGSQSASKVQSDGTILKSIVSDPRQRLAKLLSTASLAKNSKKEEENENYGIDTPSSVASEDLQAEFQKKYDTVFDQLDTLMSADEDDIDRRSYGNSLIEALSERKPSNRSSGPLHEDLSAKELFSPELNSWSNEMTRSVPMISTPSMNRGGYFARTLSGANRQNSGELTPAGAQDIPSFVVCDDGSCCRDTVTSEKVTDDSNIDPESAVQIPVKPNNEPLDSLIKDITQIAPATGNIETSNLNTGSKVDGGSVNSDDQIKALQSQLEQVMAGNDSPMFPPPDERVNDSNNDDQTAIKLDSNNQEDSCTSDVESTESEMRMIQALRSQMEQALMNSDFSRCSSAIIEEPEEETISSKQDIFVKSAAPNLLPLNMILSNDSMDSEPLLSCRSHATQVYGSLHASHAPDDLQQIPSGDCNERCTFFKKDDVDIDSYQSDNMDLNNIMANFEKEIDSLMQSNDVENTNDINTSAIGDRVAKVTKTNGVTEQFKTEIGTTSDTECTKEALVVDSMTQTKLNGDELTNLEDRLESLRESNTALGLFIQRIEHLTCGGNVEPFEPNGTLASSQRLAILEENIKQKMTYLEELNDALTKYESKLEAARQTTQSAQQDLQNSRTEHSTEIGFFIDFVNEIDSLLRSPGAAPTVDAAVSVKSKVRACINGIKELKANLERASTENQSNLAAMDSLKSERTNFKALADAAQLKNETLTNELSDLKNKVSQLQSKTGRLISEHNELRAEKVKSLADLNEMQHALSIRDDDIVKLRSSIQASEQKFKAFGAKSAEVMKARIKELKAQNETKIASLNSTISAQSLRIKELEEAMHSNTSTSNVETEIVELKANLSRTNAEKAHLEQRIKQADRSSTLKLRDVSEELVKTQNDLVAVNESAYKQQLENKSLKAELAHLRDVMSIAEESVEELQRLRLENEYLQTQVSQHRGHGALSTSFESRGRRSVESVEYGDDRFVHERISALMRESEQSNISMRTLQKENAALRDSIGKCHNEMSAMRREMKDLKMLSSARKSSPTISEDSAMTYTAYSLKTPHGTRHSHRPAYYFPVASSTLQTEDTSFSEDQLVAQLSAEKELRYKAEEICAGVLANTQAGYEKRDAEIKKLRAKLFELSSAKY